MSDGGIRYKLLKRQHDEYDLESLRSWEAIAAGGKKLNRLLPVLLPKHDQEKDDVYKRRLAAAQTAYLNYAGPMIGWFSGYLFTSAPQKQQGDGDEKEPLGEAFTEFDEDCNGRGLDFDMFMSQAFATALKKQRSYWRLEWPGEVPEGMTQADYEESGLGRPTVVEIPTENIVHWKREPGSDDKPGELVWCVEHQTNRRLENFEDDYEVVTETWTLWSRDEAPRRWQVEYDVQPKGTNTRSFTGRKPPRDDEMVAEVEGPALPQSLQGTMPVVELFLPDTLFLMGHIAGPQLEHFRKSHALSWAIDRAAFTMPVFSLKDGKKNPPTMGTGYYLMLGMGEKVEWPGPSSTPFQIIEGTLAKLKDEIFRVAHQMANGVSNNAAAIGRSGESKMADNAATEVVLKEYGRYVKAAYEKTLQLIAKGRGEDTTIHVGGMDTYHLLDAQILVQTSVALVSVPFLNRSPAALRALAKKTWRALLPDEQQTTYQQVDKDFDKNLTDDDVLAAPAMPPPPNATPPDGAPPGEGAPVEHEDADAVSGDAIDALPDIAADDFLWGPKGK